MDGKPVEVIAEGSTGRNLRFRDTRTGAEMSRDEFVRAIEGGRYPGYHVRVDGGVKTPASNPDQTPSNNLG